METGMLRAAPHLFERPKRWGRKSRQEGGPSWNTPKRASLLYSLSCGSRAWRMLPEVCSPRAIFLRKPWKAGCGAEFRSFAASSRWGGTAFQGGWFAGIKCYCGEPVPKTACLSGRSRIFCGAECRGVLTARLPGLEFAEIRGGVACVSLEPLGKMVKAVEPGLLRNGRHAVAGGF